MKMRDIINKVGMLVENGVVDRRFRYIGNCTNPELAPYLEDMMDQAKRVPYREVYAAVGRDAMAGVFGDFFWGNRPNRLKGDMALHQDPYVSFYKSKFRGFPCYFVQESGVEYVFVSPEYFDVDWDAPQHQIVAKKLYIDRNGILSTSIPKMRGVSVAITDDAMQVVQSNALNAAMAKTLRDLIRKYQPKSIDDDGDEVSVEDYLKFLRTQG